MPLGETLLKQLRDYWRVHKPTSFLFPGSAADKSWPVTAVRQEFRLAQRIAGIDRQCTTHTLRHSYASHCLQAGVKVGTIQQILGHANLETTATYTHVIGGTIGTDFTPSKSALFSANYSHLHQTPCKPQILFAAFAGQSHVQPMPGTTPEPKQSA